MWPFKQKPDHGSPTEAALAIAKSLESEPNRWTILGNGSDFLEHDSSVCIDTDKNIILSPFFRDEPDANQNVIADAVQKWIVAKVSQPKPALKSEEPPY